jgi:hypothetical protein
MHGLRKRFFIDARVSLGYPEVFESRFVLVKADDGGSSVVGTIWWLRFYNTVPIECVISFSPLRPPSVRPTAPGRMSEKCE